ncbi:MAG: hypothetical protein FWC11_06410, partial [Firmicutes bacterium]|nr:hypothetical protein [Bacillota bacterium]
VVGDRATATVRANNRTTRATVQIAIEVFYGGTTHDMGSVRRTITITVEPEEIINGGGNGNGNGDPVLPNLTGTWTGTTLFISGVGTINPLATFEQTIGHLENVFDDFYGINPNNLFVLMVIELAEMIIDDEDADNMEDAMELAFEELAFLLHYAEMEFVDNFARWYIGDFLVNEDLMIFVPTATAGLYRVYAGFETEYDWIGTFNSNTNEIRIQMMVEGAWLVLSQ